MSKWSELSPDEAMLRTLDLADDPTSRDAIREKLAELLASEKKPNLSELREMRKRWSNSLLGRARRWSRMG